MKILAIIPARGGSKGIPRKNIKLLAGKPLIFWSIDAVLKAKGINRILVSTDDEEIAAEAIRYGVQVPFLRPKEFARDESPQYETVLHALDWLEQNEKYVPDYTLLLQPTSPLRSSEDIGNAISIVNDLKPNAVVGVTEAKNHPYFIKRINEKGILESYSNNIFPKYFRRQDMPTAYVINGAIYINEINHFKKTKEFIPEGTIPLIMSPKCSVDIDSEFDFRIAESMLQEVKELH